MALDLSALRRIIADENRLLTGADIPAEYQSDVLGRVHGSAEALAFPLSTEEVSALLSCAHEHRVPVTPRGAGTNLVGSTVPLEGGIILDLSRMDRVLELDEDTMTVTVEPGRLLQDLQAYVEARGLFYPPDPGEKASSIGGNISTNAGGMRAVKYGVTRDYVRGLEVVLADGTVMQVGGKQVKDAQAPSHRLGGNARRHHKVPAAPCSQARGLAQRACAVCRPENRHPERFDHPAREREPHGGRIHGAQSRRAWRTLLRRLLSPPRRRLLYSLDL